MYTAFVNASGVKDELLGTVPAIFAKSSMLWPTLLYILTNKNIKARIFKLKYAAAAGGTKRSFTNRKLSKNKVSNDICKKLRKTFNHLSSKY
jgi:hypothetical protein